MLEVLEIQLLQQYLLFTPVDLMVVDIGIVIKVAEVLPILELVKILYMLEL